MKIPINRTAEIKVVVTYLMDSFEYEALAYVTINIQYEIEDVRLSLVECWDGHGDAVEINLSESMRIQLETMAGVKALEKIHSEDFKREDES
jgi:hypothetical protein